MPFMTSFEVEQRNGQDKPVKKDPNEGCLVCPKCKNSWFEEVKIQQYVDDHTVIPGQSIPPKNGIQFILLRCSKCTEMLEPRLLRNNRDAANSLYENFLDAMKADIKSEKV